MKTLFLLLLFLPGLLIAQLQDEVKLANGEAYSGIVISNFYPENGIIVIRIGKEKTLELPVGSIEFIRSKSGVYYRTFRDIFPDGADRLLKELLVTETELALYGGKDFKVLVDYEGIARVMTANNYRELLRRNTSETDEDILKKINGTPYRSKSISNTLQYFINKDGGSFKEYETTNLIAKPKFSYELGGGFSRQEIRTFTTRAGRSYDNSKAENGYYLNGSIHYNLLPYLSINTGGRFSTLRGQSVFIDGFNIIRTRYYVSNLNALHVPLGVRYQEVSSKYQPFLGVEGSIGWVVGGNFYREEVLRNREVTRDNTIITIRFQTGLSYELNKNKKVGAKIFYEAWTAKNKIGTAALTGRSIGLGLFIEL